MGKKFYDENGNEVKIKQKRGGCLKWLLYGFILIILLGACGALLDDGEEEEITKEQKPEETVEKEEEKPEGDVSDEETKPAEEEYEDTEVASENTKDEEEHETKTIEDIAKVKLDNVTETSEYNGELTVIFEPDFTSNDKRMLTILTDDISRFLLEVRDNAEDLNDYNSIVVMAYKDSAVLYSLRITNEQFNQLPENDLDGQIQLQYNMEEYVEQVSMLPQYREVDL